MCHRYNPVVPCNNHLYFSRIEYDAYRTDLELLAQAPRTDANTARLEEAQQNYELHKVNFEKLRSDVSIKLKFLDENRVNYFGCLLAYAQFMLCWVRNVTDVWCEAVVA